MKTNVSEIFVVLIQMVRRANWVGDFLARGTRLTI
jgi:hypothetical protein